jgi:hemerythrin superfamily protein
VGDRVTARGLHPPTSRGLGIFHARAAAMIHRPAPLLNALDLLTEQHAEFDAMFEQLESNDGDRKAAFVDLASKLAAHATIEEKLFYPRIMSEQTSDLVNESLGEHLAIKRVLADIMTVDLYTDEIAVKLSVLKEQVLHHAHEDEEAQLFPMLRTSMDAGELDGLGSELAAMYEQLIASVPRLELLRLEVLRQIAEATTPPA